MKPEQITALVDLMRQKRILRLKTAKVELELHPASFLPDTPTGPPREPRRRNAEEQRREIERLLNASSG